MVPPFGWGKTGDGPPRQRALNLKLLNESLTMTAGTITYVMPVGLRWPMLGMIPRPASLPGTPEHSAHGSLHRAVAGSV